MRRPAKKQNKTERLNLCLTEESRRALEIIAEREDRDLGYLASWFLQWGILQYRDTGLSLVELRHIKIILKKEISSQARKRLELREEATREHEEFPDEREKRRA